MTQRIIVVGAGIIGVSLAFHLAQGGAQVTVLDKEPAPTGIATQASWAWINASSGNPPHYFRLRHASMNLWRKLDKTIPGLQINWCGGLLWDMGVPELEAYVAERQAQGYAVKLVGEKEIRAREPQLLHVPSCAALADEEGAVEPGHAMGQFVSAAAGLGVSFANHASVKWLVSEGDRVTGVMTDEGELHADHIVIAAGLGSVALLESVGFRLALDAPSGLLSHSEPAPELLRGLIMAPELHVRQTAEGRLVAGSDFGGSDPGNDSEQAAAALHEKVQRLIGGAHKIKLSHFTVGYRPTPRDGVSCVGTVPAFEGLSLAVTHSGITLAPAIGAMLADVILGKPVDPLLAPFAPGRLLTRSA